MPRSAWQSSPDKAKAREIAKLLKEGLHITVRDKPYEEGWKQITVYYQDSDMGNSERIELCSDDFRVD